MTYDMVRVCMMTDKQHLYKIIQSALMAAITCIATMIIRVPSVGAVGYVNIGDAAVLISSWLIGGIYGAMAAGIGSGLADLLAGYAYYVPGTFVIKFLMALVSYIIYKELTPKHGEAKNAIRRVIPYLLSGIPAEFVMIAGYFLYKAFILGKGYAAALPSVFSNIAQGLTCLLAATLVALALKGVNLNSIKGDMR